LLNFNNETPDDFIAEHLSKLNVFGQLAVLGFNLRVVPFNGTAGSQVSAIVPEPASLSLALAALVGLLVFSRRIR